MNIQMLLADAVQVFYNSDKDSKDSKIINADDPQNLEFIKNLIK